MVGGSRKGARHFPVESGGRHLGRFEFMHVHKHVGPHVPCPVARSHGCRAAPGLPAGHGPGSLAAAIVGTSRCPPGYAGPGSSKGAVPVTRGVEGPVLLQTFPGLGGDLWSGSWWRWFPSVLASGSGHQHFHEDVSRSWKSCSVLFCKSCSKEAREMMKC